MSAKVTDIGPFGSRKQPDVGDQKIKNAEIRYWLKGISDLDERMAPVIPSFSHFLCLWANMRFTQSAHEWLDLYQEPGSSFFSHSP